MAFRPRFFAAASAVPSFVLFDESKGPLSDVVQSKDAKVIAYFTASWCGPCRAIAPAFAEAAAKNSDVKFLKIDVDENGTTAGEVSSAPSLFFAP